ncbi:Guanylate-binding protein 1 [Camelus dromedarius]|uniref:Guanylate-binding protein 1 n=1 Tax=Camelus dromedarius TaxID=9838 RepID=A0A5N4DDA1_CAMDR|nr:Guanylate-binding protein 1 [Camelus dromedarius]
MCLYRTGQSYLVNRLAGESKGFSLGSTVRPHTKGISLYSGFYGDNQKDSWIFALAALQSSTSVYNNMGPINQQGMDQLQYPFCGPDNTKSRKEQLHFVTSCGGGRLQKNSGVPSLMSPIMLSIPVYLNQHQKPKTSGHTLSLDM